MTFALSSLSRTHYDLMMLAVYMHYLCSVRIAAVVRVFGGGEHRLFLAQSALSATDTARASGRPIAAVCPAGVAVQIEVAFQQDSDDGSVRVSRDEISNSSGPWLDDHVPLEKNDGFRPRSPWRFGPHEEHHLYPLGGGRALSQRLNFRFLPALEGDERGATVSDGTGLPETVAGAMGMMGSPFAPAPLGAPTCFRDEKSRLHCDWCLRNSIRYFYATPKPSAATQ